MPRFPPNPDRRPAVVTGASSGIGRATAAALAALGHPVVLGARRVAECEDAAAEIRSAGGEAVAIHLDLADDDVGRAVREGGRRHPGRRRDRGVERRPEHGRRRARHRRRLRSTGCCRSTSPAPTGSSAPSCPTWWRRRRGDVVFVTSDVAERPRPAMAAYVTSKWGLEGYVRSLQMELEGTGVRATILRPGPTLTGMGMDWDPDVTAEVIEQWASWGFARHSNFMRPAGVAQAVCAVVWTPPRRARHRHRAAAGGAHRAAGRLRRRSTP